MLVADRMLDVQQAMLYGVFDRWEIGNPRCLLELHCRLVGEIHPRDAGVWRNRPVQFGPITPPPAAAVPGLMQEYHTELADRFIHLTPSADEQAPATLAFAEGRLLWIHPFNQFSLHVGCLWLRYLLWVARLPQVQLLPSDLAGDLEYGEALQAVAREDWLPLTRLWERRFEQAPSPPGLQSETAPAGGGLSPKRHPKGEGR